MKICLWGSIAGALTGKTDGGSELQMALMAKALARGGHEVICIDPQAENDFVTAEGIKILMVKGWNSGIRNIRLFTHRMPGLYKMLRKQKADIYYCRMRDFNHIFAYWASRRARSKFILAMASDLDAMGFKMRFKYFYLPNRAGLWWLFSGILIELIHPWLLRKADSVFVQHEGQKQILMNKGIRSVSVPNLIDLSQLPDIRTEQHNDFVYVGWLDKRKGITEFFEIIERSPSVTFKIIGPPRDKTGHLYYEKLKSFQNVRLLGEQTHSDTLLHIASSKALISTSPMEGFPNIFIEAWACGIPVISLYFDPGGVIRNEGLGEVADGNIEKLLSSLDSVAPCREFSNKAMAYLENNHALNEYRVRAISELFNNIYNNTAD
jgi:glycosyltransferase involved in cell wall biosynthesis